VSKGWAGGSTTAWRRTRRAVLLRDAALGYHCRAHQDGWCERANTRPHTCTRQPTEAHHTHGKAQTGDDPAHIVSSCRTCNLAIGDPTKAPDPTPTPRTRW
jgi:hypothetical protein